MRSNFEVGGGDMDQWLFANSEGLDAESGSPLKREVKLAQTRSPFLLSATFYYTIGIWDHRFIDHFYMCIGDKHASWTCSLQNMGVI